MSGQSQTNRRKHPRLAIELPVQVTLVETLMGELCLREAARRRGEVDTGKAAAAWTDAFLSCADAGLDAGRTRLAARIYRRMAARSRPRRVRFAALRGLVSAEPEVGVSLVVEALRDEDTLLQRMASRLVGEM